MNVAIDSKKIIFAAQDLMMDYEANFIFQVVSPESYPFDTYYTEFYIQCHLVNDTASGPEIDVPMSLSIEDVLPDWRTGITAQDFTGNFSMIKISLIANRSVTQIFFCLLIIMIMWAMTLGVFYMALMKVQRI